MRHGADLDAADPAVGLLVADRFDEGPEYRTVRRRGSSSWLLLLTLEGEGYAGRGRVREGRAVLLPPMEPQEYGTGPGGRWSFLWAHFHARAEWGGLLDWRPSAEGLRAAVAPPVATLAMTQAVSLSRAGRALVALNRLEACLLALEPPGPGRLDPRVERALALVAGDLRRPWSVRALADEVGLGEDRFRKLFLAETGEGVREHVERLRLARAADLLRMTDLPIARVAEAAGFRDAFYFSTRFRRWAGKSPRESRREDAGAP